MPRPNPLPEPYADIQAFTAWLEGIFGDRERGLAAVLRASPEFGAWCQRHQWCACCRAYAPIVRTGRRLARFTLHRMQSVGVICAGSDRETAWPAAVLRQDPDVPQDTLLRLARAAGVEDTWADRTRRQLPCND